MRSRNAMLKSKDRGNPWHHAAKADRVYLTPEDVTAAAKAGGETLDIAEAVLVAVESGCVEDVSLTAFAALMAFGRKPKKGT